MRHFDRRDVEVHVACTTRETMDPAVSVIRKLRAIPDLRIVPTHFGSTLDGASGWARVRRISGMPIVPISLVSLATYIRRHRIQLIHGTEKPRDAVYGVVLGKLTGARTLIHMHVSYGDWQSRAVKWALGQADAVVGVSHFTAESIVQAGYAPDRVFAVHNGLDASEWDPTADGRDVRRELGIPGDAPLLGIVSRLFSWKGHGALLDALALVKLSVPDVRLLIVGEDDPRGQPGGGSYRADLESQARRLQLVDNVIFTGFRTDVPRLMAALDVFVLPSWEEPFGMVYLEAMAMEKPVVAWASAGALEVVVHNETGLLAERGSTTALADAILRLLRSPDLRRRFGEAGRRRVIELFSPERTCQAMVDVYRAVLTRRTSRWAALPSSSP
jgi:glycosyltransferase involved in cell wall biosynthesis